MKHIQNIGKLQHDRVKQLELSIEILSDHINKFKDEMNKETLSFLLSELTIMRRELEIRKFYLK
ncbi:MAG: hypothetical protein P8Y70_04465 [Candidatus Lokiarchaeota archaeon]